MAGRRDGERRARELRTIWLLERAHALLRNLFDILEEPVEDLSLVSLPQAGVSLKAIERAAILTALERTVWVQQDAAKLLRISPRVLNYKMQQHGIKRRKDTDLERPRTR